MPTPASERHAPRRHIDKKEAVRHLIHAAIRFVAKEEDPFAIHLVIHSADKLLIDIAKKQRKELKIDWEVYIKDQHHAEFFDQYRATYNYLKHAKKDLDRNLPVHDIMMINLMMIFACAVNYAKVFGQHTSHMTLFLIFIHNLVPTLIVLPKNEQREFLKSQTLLHLTTPREFFEQFGKGSRVLPTFDVEVAKDLEDVVDFYNLSFADLRAGRKTRQRRYIREY